MELYEAINNRRSIRKFTSEPIEPAVIERIVNAAMWAPSAQNLQPWYFVVLTKQEDLSVLFAELGTTAFSHRKELEARFKNNPEVVEETMEFMSAMGGAPVMALAFLNKPNYTDDIMPSCIESVSAAMENMCLAAYAEGLGSCWVEAVSRASDALRDAFAPGHGALIGGVVLGHPAQEARPIRRKPGRFEIR